MTDYLVRFAALKLPMRLDASGVLRHAVPRHEYSRFPSRAEADDAIRSSGYPDDEYEVVTVDEHEGALSALEQRAQRLRQARRQRTVETE